MKTFKAIVLIGLLAAFSGRAVAQVGGPASHIQADLYGRLIPLKELIAQNSPGLAARINAIKIDLVDNGDPGVAYASYEDNEYHVTFSLGFGVMLFELASAMQTLTARQAIAYGHYRIDRMLENTRRSRLGQDLLPTDDPPTWAHWSEEQKQALEQNEAKQQEIQAIYTGALAFTLAHEFGHHLLGHTRASGQVTAEQQRQRETAADAWACDAMARCNIGPIVGFYALIYFALTDANALEHETGKTHPADIRRIDVMVDKTVQGIESGQIQVQQGAYGKEQVIDLLKQLGEFCKLAIQNKDSWDKLQPGQPIIPQPEFQFKNQQEAADNIEKGESTHFDWHRTADNPTVDYRVQYTNKGAQAIRCSIRVTVGTVLRTAPSPLKKFRSWKPTEQKQHDFVLKPRESVILTGTLQWFSDETVMPSMRAPDPSVNDYGDLFRCEFVTQ